GRRRGHGQLRDLVELRAALHRGAGLRLRVLVRLPLLARHLPALSRGGRGSRRAVPRSPARGRLGTAGGARVATRLRHRRPGLLVERPGCDRSARGRSRAARRPARRSQVTDCYLAGARVLVVAATGRELVPVAGAQALVCGIGPIDAAISTARAIAEERPATVLNVGIAGARGLEPLSLVLGSEAVYCDADGPLV